MSGYLHPAYADALAEFGTPRYLKHSGGWVLVSSIENSIGLQAYDARGCYPLFACCRWSSLFQDLEDIKNDLVSLVLVSDPFGDYSPSLLRECFPDLFKPYKEHYVIDLSTSPGKNISDHHTRYIRKAKKVVSVEHCTRPTEYLHQWVSLYTNLVRRHNIRGISAFSENSFRKQLQIPGLEMFRAIYDGKTVGIMLIFLQGNVGYYHLSAYSEEGYKHGVSFALLSYIIEYFGSRLRWINLGAGAGIYENQNDGLTRFKRGWTSNTIPVYICGRIFNRSLYNKLTREHGGNGKDFFPLYRKDVIG
jgi:hypothetical protein